MVCPRDHAWGSAAMNRIKDYTGFVGWFAGLGYIVLWPLTVDNLSGQPFGAAWHRISGTLIGLSLQKMAAPNGWPLKLSTVSGHNTI